MNSEKRTKLSVAILVYGQSRDLPGREFFTLDVVRFDEMFGAGRACPGDNAVHFDTFGERELFVRPDALKLGRIPVGDLIDQVVFRFL